MKKNTYRRRANIIIGSSRGLEQESVAVQVPTPALRVTSHVARDLLQNAAYFNSVPKAVTEYVTNAIDNAIPGKPVYCAVNLSRACIRISDNASGMSHAELFNFFQMHGENVNRKRGRAVRGKFGTGKSAAFGIASTLQIETVKEGMRNVVEIKRADVEDAKNGQPIPVRELVVNEAISKHSGTTIVIQDLLVKNVDAEATRAYLEKTLGRHLRVHQISVNGVMCKYRGPVAVKTFRFKLPRDAAEKIGAATCVLEISKEPLAHDENAVAVLSNSFLHATTLAGKQGQPFVEYIFGEVEVPSLDTETDPIPAFDNTRSLTLNPQNPRVQALSEWLARCIEEVRQYLIERDKRRSRSKEMRLLQKVSGEIGNFLTEDFRVMQEATPWTTRSGERHRHEKRSRTPRREERITAPHDPAPFFEHSRRASDRQLGIGNGFKRVGSLRNGRVHFEINCVHMGTEAPRARHITDRAAIYLNRDHPQIRAAELEAGLKSPTFKILLFDIAFTEYAFAVVSQLADQGVEVADPIDANEMVQEILDRLNRKAAVNIFEKQAARAELEIEDDEDVEEEQAKNETAPLRSEKTAQRL